MDAFVVVQHGQGKTPTRFRLQVAGKRRDMIERTGFQVCLSVECAIIEAAARSSVESCQRQ